MSEHVAMAIVCQGKENENSSLNTLKMVLTTPKPMSNSSGTMYLLHYSIATISMLICNYLLILYI